jgi:hypothetical protein
VRAARAGQSADEAAARTRALGRSASNLSARAENAAIASQSSPKKTSLNRPPRWRRQSERGSVEAQLGLAIFLPNQACSCYVLYEDQAARRAGETDMDPTVDREPAPAKQRLTIFAVAALRFRVFAPLIAAWSKPRSWVRSGRMNAAGRGAEPRLSRRDPAALGAPPSIRPEMAPQALEKPRFAPENGMGPGSFRPTRCGTTPRPFCLGHRPSPVRRSEMAGPLNLPERGRGPRVQPRCNALTMASVIFLASPNSISVLS